MLIKMKNKRKEYVNKEGIERLEKLKKNQFGFPLKIRINSEEYTRNYDTINWTDAPIYKTEGVYSWITKILTKVF